MLVNAALWHTQCNTHQLIATVTPSKWERESVCLAFPEIGLIGFLKMSELTLFRWWARYLRWMKSTSMAIPGYASHGPMKKAGRAIRTPLHLTHTKWKSLMQVRLNMPIDTDPYLQEAASLRRVMGRSFSR